MTYRAHATILQASSAAPERTKLSVEFEAHWRALPMMGLMPARSAFRPQGAARFLRHLVLCDAALEGQPAIRMRLIGSEFESRVHRNVKGEDYLQFIPELYRRGAIDSVRQIIERPCGLWQLTPLHYERCSVRNVEITLFPLKPEIGGVYQLLILTQFIGGPLMAYPASDKIISADTAENFRYIDVGAGVPP